MTTEEKAKAYDESLKKARYYYDKCYMMINTALENIFPELAESEDERIRRELIDFVDISILSIDERHDRWIAWLEKQGEHKLAWSEEDEKMREKLLFLMEEENSIESWAGCYEWLKSLNMNEH